MRSLVDISARLRGCDGARLCQLAREFLRRWDPSETHAQWDQILRRATPAEIAAFLEEDTSVSRRLQTSSPFRGLAAEAIGERICPLEERPLRTSLEAKLDGALQKEALRPIDQQTAARIETARARLAPRCQSRGTFNSTCAH